MNNEIILAIIKHFGRIKNITAFIIFILFVIFFSWLADSLVEVVRLLFQREYTTLFIILSLTFSGSLFIYFYFKHYNVSIYNFQLSDFITVSLVIFSFGIAGFNILKILNSQDFMYFIQFYFSSNFFFAIWILLRNININLRFSVKEIPQRKNDFKALIVFLSVINDPNKLQKVMNSKDIEEVFESFVPWEMQLRIIKAFQTNLKFVYVIGSKDSIDPQTSRLIPGSYNQIEYFSELLMKFFDIVIEKHNIPLDFEDLRANIEALEEAYSKLHSKGLRSNEILIDITGGKKIQSSAGAFSGLAYDRYFCYVSPDNKEKIIIYDVVMLEN